MRKTDNVHHTSLCAKFNFGDVEIERIECFAGDDDADAATAWSAAYPTIIRATVGLESSTLALVLDACDEAEADELVLDRTIAPFQCAVLAASPDGDRHLSDLVQYVRLLLSRAGIAMYEADDGASDPEGASLCADARTQRQRIAHLDRIGVPYVLLLNGESLRRGFMELRNRDTTLCETIHISDVPGYLVDIFGLGSTSGKK